MVLPKDDLEHLLSIDFKEWPAGVFDSGLRKKFALDP